MFSATYELAEHQLNKIIADNYESAESAESVRTLTQKGILNDSSTDSEQDQSIEFVNAKKCVGRMIYVRQRLHAPHSPWEMKEFQQVVLEVQESLRHPLHLHHSVQMMVVEMTQCHETQVNNTITHCISKSLIFYIFRI